MSAARVFGVVVSGLVWAAGTYWYGFWPGLIASIVAYFAGVWVYAVAQLVGSAVGNTVSGLAERRRSR